MLSVAYYALVKLGDHRVRGATDAREASWFVLLDPASSPYRAQCVRQWRNAFSSSCDSSSLRDSTRGLARLAALAGRQHSVAPGVSEGATLLTNRRNRSLRAWTRIVVRAGKHFRAGRRGCLTKIEDLIAVCRLSDRNGPGAIEVIQDS